MSARLGIAPFHDGIEQEKEIVKYNQFFVETVNNVMQVMLKNSQLFVDPTFKSLHDFSAYVTINPHKLSIVSVIRE